MVKTRKKTIKRIVSLICIVAVVGFLAAMPLIAKEKPEEDEPKASILSGTVEIGAIDTELMGGGTLSQEDSVPVSVPSGVLLKDFLVSNGDKVTVGTAIATVDGVSTMKAIIAVQETLNYLSEEIEKVSDKGEKRTVSALAGGTVKIMYATEGDWVQAVMLEHGALAVLSLDGLMAVEFATDSDLPAATEVTVTLSNGTAVAGKVEKNLLGQMTVTVEDDAYTVGQNVEVSDPEGNVVGSGELYIYSPWNVTAYAGTVSSVEAGEEDGVEVGDALLILADVGNSAAYGQLVGQRRAYETLMQELFTLYQTEVVVAPCEGVISGIDKSSLQLLTAKEGNAEGNGVTLQATTVVEESYGITLLSNATVRLTEETDPPATTDPVETEPDPDGTDDSQNSHSQGGNTDIGGSDFGSTNGGMGGFVGGFTGGSMGGFTGGSIGDFTGSFGEGTADTEPEFELYSMEVTSIASVTPMDTMELEISVDESDIASLRIGMLAEIRMDALGGEKTTAVITDIGNIGSGNGGNSKFSVKLTMDRGENMLPGMTAQATIGLSSAEEILTIPASALVENGNTTMVYTAYDEENEILLNPVIVETGVSDGNTVQILSGLAEGQTYYYGYYDTIPISFAPDFGGGMPFFGR